MQNKKSILAIISYLIITVILYFHLDDVPRDIVMPYFSVCAIGILYFGISVWVIAKTIPVMMQFVLLALITAIGTYSASNGAVNDNVLAVGNIPIFPMTLYFGAVVLIALSFYRADPKDDSCLRRMSKYIEKNIYFFIITSIVIISVATFADIPYFFKVGISGVIIMILLIAFGIRIRNKKQQAMAVVAVAMLCIMNWMWISYDSYYSGVKATRKMEAKQDYSVSVLTLESNLDDKQKKQMLKKQFEQSKAKISITKNGKSYYDKYINRNTNEYILEEYYYDDKKNAFPPITDSLGNVYEYRYFYANRPHICLGVSRAISYSIVPDIQYLGNREYLEAKLYERSTNFWIPFWAIYCVVLMLMFYKVRLDDRNVELDAKNTELANAKAKVDAKNTELETANKELTTYQLTHDLLMDQFDRQTRIEINQQLQKAELDWGELTRQLVGEERHKLKNQLHALSLQEEHITREEFLMNPVGIEEKLREKVLKPSQNEIMEIIKELPNVLDYRSSEIEIGKIIEATIKAVPSTFRNDPYLRGAFSEHEEVNADQRMLKCKVNNARLGNIVDNILTNANRALSKYRREKRREGIKYAGSISLTFSMKENEDGNNLVISVMDNAGGFPEEIVDKVYREPVMSSDKTRGERFGAGTSYVRFFADRMGIKVKAWNICEEESVVGAAVELWIPVISDADKGVS